MKLVTLKKYKLSTKPGIYMFLDAEGKPLYIGRATSLKDRVKSYFSNDLITTRGPRIIDMVTRAKGINTIELNSVLESVIQEGILIRKYQPKYNVDDKDDKSALYIVVTDEKLPRVFTERARDFDKKLSDKTLEYVPKKVFGPYPQTGLIKEALKILRKLFPFRDKNAGRSKYEQFYVAIERSPDMNDGDEIKVVEYNRTIDYLIKFFEGKRNELERSLKSDMQTLSDELRFEEAGQVKRLLYAIQHINDIALIKRDKVSTGMRIEAYDVAHISGAEKVGAMVVMNGSIIDKNEQRFFKMKQDTNDDVAGLAEILFRRLKHSEWQYPDLIVVDGGEAQLKTAINILSAGRFDIPVVGVTKDERHKAAKIIGDKRFSTKFKKEIVELNAEVHRVAIGYHRKRMRNRIKNLL